MGLDIEGDKAFLIRDCLSADKQDGFAHTPEPNHYGVLDGSALRAPSEGNFHLLQDLGSSGEFGRGISRTGSVRVSDRVHSEFAELYGKDAIIR